MTEHQEIEAVQIKHRGQCPKPKGHAVEAIFFAIVFTFFATMIGVTWLISIVDGAKELRSEAIKRGYAAHNPKTGAWEWR